MRRRQCTAMWEDADGRAACRSCTLLTVALRWARRNGRSRQAGRQRGCASSPSIRPPILCSNAVRRKRYLSLAAVGRVEKKRKFRIADFSTIFFLFSAWRLSNSALQPCSLCGSLFPRVGSGLLLRIGGRRCSAGGVSSTTGAERVGWVKTDGADGLAMKRDRLPVQMCLADQLGCDCDILLRCAASFPIGETDVDLPLCRALSQCQAVLADSFRTRLFSL